MAYEDLLLEESSKTNFLAILKPRRKVTTWTLSSGAIYYNAFDWGQVVGVVIDGTSLTEASSISLGAGEFYWDPTTERLYVRKSDNTNPTGDFTVATYELYCGTFDAHWFRDPLDDTSRVVYYEPIIDKSPNLKSTISDSLFGYLPVQSSSITLNNLDHFLEHHIYDSSFNRASIFIYHWIDDLDVDNIKLVKTGLMGDISYSDEKASIKIADMIDIFSAEYRHANENFFDKTLFPDLDPGAIGRPIKKIYGFVEGVVPTNIDYLADAPTTSDNRSYVVMTGQSILATISTVVIGSSSTTTRTYVTLNAAQGLQEGDSVWLSDGMGGDDYVLVTAVDPGFDYFDHTTIGSPRAAGDTVKRSFIGNIKIIQEDKIYTALYGRDWLPDITFAGVSSGFTFDSSLESNLSITNTLSPGVRIYCRVYGQINNVMENATAFGGNDTTTKNLTHPTVILWDILKGLPVTEDQMDGDSFRDVYSDNTTEAVGFCIPENNSGSFPKYKDLIIDLIQTQLTRLIINNDGVWQLTRLQPLGSVDKSIDNEEILKNSISYSFEYADVFSDILLQYGFREQLDQNKSGSGYVTISATSENARLLHQVNKQKKFDSLHFREADAQVLIDRLSFVFGERSGQITLQSKNKLFDTLISDVLSVTRTKMPGFEYDPDTERTRSFDVIQVNKTLKSVTIEASDNKGIEDNSGDW